MTAADIARLQHRAQEQDASLRAVSDTVIDIKDTVDQHSGQLTAIQRTLAEHGRRLGSLDEGQESLRSGQESLVTGQESLRSGQESLRSGQESLRSEVTDVKDMLGEVLRRLEPR